MTVHTIGSLHKKANALTRRNRGIEQTVAMMREGALLHLTQRLVLKSWTPSNGISVRDEDARIIIARGDIVGMGDALFEGSSSQTYRYQPGGGRRR